MRVRGADATGRTRDGTGRCFYTRLPHLVKVAQMAPSERTAANLDRSAQLREVIDTQLGGDEAQLLGGSFRGRGVWHGLGRGGGLCGVEIACVSRLVAFSCSDASVEVHVVLAGVHAFVRGIMVGGVATLWIIRDYPGT